MPAPSQQPFPDFDYADPVDRTPKIPDAFKPTTPGQIVKYQPPAPTPIYPQPINPPEVPKVPVPASRGRTGGRIGGSFKAPPIPIGTAGGFIARRIPYVAVAFAAYDAYQFACALGLLPGSICPRPDNPSPGGSTPEFTGGQCVCVLYNIRVRFTFDGSTAPGEQLVSGNGDVQAYGPISGSRTTTLPNDGSGFVRTRIEISCRGLNGEACTSSQVWRTGVDIVYEYRSHTIENRGTAGGGLDNCGNPQPQPQQNQPPTQVINISPTNIFAPNITIPSPTSPNPLPRRPPFIIAPPSPLPDINITFPGGDYPDNQPDIPIQIDIIFSPQPTTNIPNFPDAFNNFPPSPAPTIPAPNPILAPNPPVSPAPVAPPVPQVPKPVPITLPETRTEADEYIMRQNKEILDKLYRVNGEIDEIQANQDKQNKILDNLQKLLDFEVEGSQTIKRCDDLDTVYSFKDKVLRAISKQVSQTTAIEQTIINEICDVQKESIVAIPEWWQVRVNNNVPQICLIFRSLGTKTYHKLNIPHPLNITKLTLPPIATYLKGNWQAQLILIDNSKFIINCKTKGEAERVTLIALSLIDPIFIGNNPKLYFAERRGEAIRQTTMKATSAMYFSTGQQNLEPDWHAAFK